MRITLLTVALYIVAATTALGQIDATSTECDRRYGRPEEVSTNKEGHMLRGYYQGPLLVIASGFLPDSGGVPRAGTMVYKRRDGQPLSTSDIERLLSVNSGSMMWLPLNRRVSTLVEWGRTDGAMAVYNQENGALLIESAAWVRHEQGRRGGSRHRTPRTLLN